jgi:hypothetical protein
MYKTPTFAEPQQYNRPFSTGQLSAFIIQLVLWHVLPRSEWTVQGRTQVKYLIGQLSAFIIQLVIWHVLPRSERKNKISCNKNAIKNTEMLENYIYCIPIKKFNKSVLIS